MKNSLLALLVCLFASSPCWAWTIKIKNGDLAYEGKILGNEMIYTSTKDRKILGTSRKLGNEIVYKDGNGQHVGSLNSFGNNEWNFKDKKGAVIGSAVLFGKELTYKDARGRHVGKAVVVGGRTLYKDGRNRDIGSADTDTMPLRPVPLEEYLLDMASPGVCLTKITGISWSKGAALAGVRAGDILIGYENAGKTVFDYLQDDCQKMHQQVKELVKNGNDTEDAVMIVYRPASNDNGQAKGKIYKTGKLPSGLKGFNYTTEDSGPSSVRRSSADYAGQIKKLYGAGNFTEAPVNIPPADSQKKDDADLPGVHQDFREEIVGGRAKTGWFWVRDSDGRVLSAAEVRSLKDKAARNSGPKVSITSYPGARIFVSTTESTGNGDPAVNSHFKLIGVTDSSGKLHFNGGNTYALPAGARFLGFSADVVDIDMAEVENHPMITSLSENTQPQVREAMVQQVITQMAKAKGLKPEKKTGYMVLESGKMSYDLR